ncbi:MAG: polysaccharide biosynthesis tyrosine autokinase, partial [Acidimicrobiales bacterium]
LTEREAALLAELETLAADIAAAGDNGARVRALEYREISKREELAGIGSKLANLGAISVDPGEVLSDAGLPDAKTGIPAAAGPFSGALVGVMLGLAVAFLLDRQDDRVRTATLELSSMGLPLLGSVPVGKGLFKGGNGSAIAEINSEEGEAYRRVQGSLLFNLDQADKSMVLVAGTNNPHSATTVAANLATAAARSGRRTLLVGADLRRPSMHERFGLDNDAGLSDVLSGQASLSKSIKILESVPNLQILTSGTQVADPARLLQGEAFGRLVASARNEFDLVVFEAPPVLQVADAVDLARLCEGAVLVIEPDRATRSGVADSVEQLRRVGADVLGTVVAKPAVADPDCPRDRTVDQPALPAGDPTSRGRRAHCRRGRSRR